MKLTGRGVSVSFTSPITRGTSYVYARDSVESVSGRTVTAIGGGCSLNAPAAEMQPTLDAEIQDVDSAAVAPSLPQKTVDNFTFPVAEDGEEVGRRGWWGHGHRAQAEDAQGSSAERSLPD
jgi:hypothetical protein